MALLAIIGPGLIVMVGDNDAGGVATYSQAGQNYGTSLLWVLLLLVPVLIVNQEMVVRLGAVTGVGHARLINERFGRFWGWFSVGDLFLLELPDDRHRVHRREPCARLLRRLRRTSPSRSPPGCSLRSRSPAASAPGSVAMFVFVAANFLVIPLFFMARPDAGTVAQHFVVPAICGRRELDLGAVDHRDGRHHRRALAAVLPAVEHHRQADHAALDQL